PMRKTILAAVLLSLFATPAFAQVATTSSRGGLTLDQAVSAALARNPNVQTAELELERSRALLMEARASSMPTIVGNATYTRPDAARTTPGGPAATATPRVVTPAE